MRVLFFLIGCFCLGGCSSPNRCPVCRAVTVAKLPQPPSQDKSLYEPDSDWTTDAGSTMKLSALTGEPCVLSFFFASCTFKCPITVENMRQVEASLPRESRKRVRFVLVTFDPAFDTCEVLRRYRTAHRLNGENWILLRGEPGEVRALAQRAGFVYEKNGVGGFNHDSLISVLDSTGRLAFQHGGLYNGVNEIQLKVRALLQPDK